MNPTMKYPFLLAFLLFTTSYTAFCQAKLIAPSAKYKRMESELVPLKDKQPIAFAFSSIEVLDVRQDTTKFGYSGSAPRKYCFKNNMAASLAYFLNNSVTPVSLQPGQKLLYCLKKCWMINIDTSYDNIFALEVPRSKLYFAAELYLEKDSICYPLYRFDSLFIYNRQMSFYSGKWIGEALLRSLHRLQDLDPTRVVKRSSLRRSEINSYYADEKHTALASLPAPVKGVYLTIAQFKNNQPAFTDFEINYDKLVDIMRIKDTDGNYKPTTKDWGYSDGENCFMRLGQNYFQLFKTGDTYELYGAIIHHDVSSYTMPAPYLATGAAAGVMPMTTVRNNRYYLDKLRPLQLDMETGKVYY